jgi:hypothetical protein
MITSITLGLLIIFSLKRSSTVSTTKKTLAPSADLTLSTIFLALAAVLKTPSQATLERPRDQKNHRRRRQEPREPS